MFWKTFLQPGSIVVGNYLLFSKFLCTHNACTEYKAKTTKVSISASGRLISFSASTGTIASLCPWMRLESQGKMLLACIVTIWAFSFIRKLSLYSLGLKFYNQGFLKLLKDLCWLTAHVSMAILPSCLSNSSLDIFEEGCKVVDSG